LQIGGNAGGASTISPNIAAQFQKINSVLNQGSVTPTSDPNLSSFSFLTANRTTLSYPALRFDDNAADSVRLYLSYSQTMQTGIALNAPNFPGGIDRLDLTSSNNNKISGLGADWVIRPTLISQFHAGYMYQYGIFDPENLGIDLPSISQQTWNYGLSLYGANSGATVGNPGGGLPAAARLFAISDADLE
jgi:hypothetical protein